MYRERGADTWLPFKSGLSVKKMVWGTYLTTLYDADDNIVFQGGHSYQFPYDGCPEYYTMTYSNNNYIYTWNKGCTVDGVHKNAGETTAIYYTTGTKTIIFDD